MIEKAFIFIGRSGCGKGTQLKLLKDYLISKNSEIKHEIVTMGDVFRSFFEKEGYVQGVAKKISIKEGGFQPDFLTNTLFVNEVINKINTNVDILFLDGYPRNLNQLGILKSVLSYFNCKNLIVINIDVSEKDVKERMLKRGRGDDNNIAINNRLKEYKENVIPMIKAIKKDKLFKYFEINGEPTIEEIHEDIIFKLKI